MSGGFRHMGARLALEIAPASLFGASVGFAASAAALPLPAAVAGTFAAFLLAWSALHRLDGEPETIALPQFELAALVTDEVLEPPRDDPADIAPLELTTADIFEARQPDGETGELLLDEIVAQQPAHGDELLLEDMLGGLQPESRVVRLFESGACPTAGELHHRIERHLGAGTRAIFSPPDATRELHEALDALRRSLR